MAISAYDHVRDLTSGRVRVEGVALRSQELVHEEIFHRTLRTADWDVAEMSLAKYAALVAEGESRFTAIPVFPSRTFRHSSIYVGRGGSVGVPEWAQTAAVYTRALLAEEHGVALRDVRWVVAGVNSPGRAEKVAVTPPDGVRVERIVDRTLDDMLAAGELDAVLSARPPASLFDPLSPTRRFFEDHQAVEADYAERTGIVPIMHVVVVRRSLADAHPWLPGNLYDAFDEARRRSLARLRDMSASRYPLLWSASALARTAAVMNGDPWAYGIEANRTVLKAFLGWARAQGVLRREPAVKELFAPGVHAQYVI